MKIKFLWVWGALAPNLKNVQELLKNDAKKVFNGNIIVPNDGDEIEFI